MFFLFIKWKGYSKNWLRAKQEFIIFFIPKCVTIYICPEPRHFCLVSQSVTVRYLYYLHTRVPGARIFKLEFNLEDCPVLNAQQSQLKTYSVLTHCTCSFWALINFPKPCMVTIKWLFFLTRLLCPQFLQKKEWKAAWTFESFKAENTQVEFITN